MRDNRRNITDFLLTPHGAQSTRYRTDPVSGMDPYNKGVPINLNYSRGVSEKALDDKVKLLGKAMDDATTAFSRAGGSMLQLYDRFSDKLGLHQTSQTDAWNNAPNAFPRGGILGGGGRAIGLPAAPGAPGAGVGGTRIGAGNAAGIAGAAGAGAEVGAAGPRPGPGSAAGSGNLWARLGTMLSSVDWNYFMEMKEIMLLAQEYEASASRELNPYKTALPRQGSLAASNWGWAPGLGQSTVINDQRTTNITVSTSDPVRAGEVAGQAANPPYSTPGAYAPAAC